MNVIEMTSCCYSDYFYVHSNSCHGEHRGNGVTPFHSNTLREFSCMVLDRANDVYQSSYQSRYIGYPMMLEYPFRGAYSSPYHLPHGRFYGYYDDQSAMPNMKAAKGRLMCPVCYRNFARESTLKVSDYDFELRHQKELCIS